jgi:hypothetical protein
MSKRTSVYTTAIVFGAGASVPPLMSQQGLVQELLKDQTNPRIWPAKKYLRHSFPGLLSRKTEPRNEDIRFEDIVGPLEIAEAEEYWFHFGGSGEPGFLLTNRQVLNSLDTWVAMALDPQSIPKPSSGKGPKADGARKAYKAYYAPGPTSDLAYGRLISILRSNGLLEQTAFLSMNYDVLLDRVIHASTSHIPDYGIDGFYDPNASADSSEKERASVLILKLHGSLNWRACDNCHILRNLKEYISWPGDKCIDCGEKTARPMLIRPTLLKDFRHRVWKDVWRRAGHVLAGASKWIFVGYSLPLADVWMLRLLAQSSRSGGIVPRDRKIVVVNSDPQVEQRFSLLFPEVDFRQMDFGVWTDGLTGGNTK